MARRIFSQLIFNSNSPKLKSFLSVPIKKLHTEIPFKEIQIPVSYGHISAKLWGKGNGRPILALHGWQDNAGTWDPLIPMIIKDRPILAIDFPGHGLSSWYPPGMMYYSWELPRVVLFLKNYFNWDKVSLLCHSMGSIAGLRYACLYPNDVDFYIAIDSLVYDDYDLNLVIENYPEMLMKGLKSNERLNKQPPVYTLEQIENIWHLGTRKSVALESVKYLLQRGSKQAENDPNKYFFSRDSRLKYVLFNPEKIGFVEALVRRLMAPTLYIKANDSPYSSDEHSVEMREIVERNNKDYELHFVPGKHHVHLNDPGVVAPLILNFLQKHNMEH